MSQIPVEPNFRQADEIRKIPRFARQYAQNRSMGVLVAIVLFAATFAAISGTSYLFAVAYRAANLPLLAVASATLPIAVAAWVWMSVPQWGGRSISRLTLKIYAPDGNIGLTTAHQASRTTAVALVVFLLFGTTLVVLLGLFDIVSYRLLQPASAMFVVPFLIGLWLVMRPMVGFAALLWPALYSLHAAFILAGFPIVFERPWDWLNMLIPTIGYGMLSALLGHLIGQSAIKKLKKVTLLSPANIDPKAAEL